jgi:hypothetical protein
LIRTRYVIELQILVTNKIRSSIGAIYHGFLASMVQVCLIRLFPISRRFLRPQTQRRIST